MGCVGSRIGDPACASGATLTEPAHEPQVSTVADECHEPPFPPAFSVFAFWVKGPSSQCAAEHVLRIGEQWGTDDYDARMSAFAGELKNTDAAGRERLMMEILKRDPHAFSSWLTPERANAMQRDGRISADDKALIAEAFVQAFTSARIARMLESEIGVGPLPGTGDLGKVQFHPFDDVIAGYGDGLGGGHDQVGNAQHVRAFLDFIGSSQAPEVAQFRQVYAKHLIDQFVLNPAVDSNFPSQSDAAAGLAANLLAEDPAGATALLSKYKAQDINSFMQAALGSDGLYGEHVLKVPASDLNLNVSAIAVADGARRLAPIAIELARHMKACGEDPSTVVKVINESVARYDVPRIAQGGSPVATLELAKAMRAAGLDHTAVLTNVIDGIRQFKDHVSGDVRKLAGHDAELAWLVRNCGAGMKPEQLTQAINHYRDKQDAAWKGKEDALRKVLADDGTKLLEQMGALNSAQAQLSGSGPKIDATLRTLLNDQAAALAITTAIQTNPAASSSEQVKSLFNVYSAAKLGDAGRKLLNEAASAYVREQVLKQLVSVDLRDAHSVAAAKDVIRALHSENFARLLGVPQSELEKGVKALEKVIDDVAQTPTRANEALKNFDKALESDGLSAFRKTTFAGQTLRGIGLAFAGAGVLNSYNTVNGHPDPQNVVKLMVDSIGFLQKGSEIASGFSAIPKDSWIAQFGGEWKLIGRAGAAELIGGIGALLDTISAVRSFGGWGVPQDTTSGVLSLVSAGGGALAVLPTVGGSVWLGPVGIGLVAASVCGKAIYEGIKDAHKYESAAQEFLKAGGFSDAAANALSKQGGFGLSPASGASQIPFLLRYAEIKGVSPERLQLWVNNLSAEQLSTLSNALLLFNSHHHGDPSRFRETGDTGLLGLDMSAQTLDQELTLHGIKPLSPP
jgi:hypothetical protein